MKNGIDKTRFSITIPLDLAIKLDMELEKLKFSRNSFIKQAIEEKLNSLNEKELVVLEIEKIKNEIEKIKKIIFR